MLMLLVDFTFLFVPQSIQTGVLHFCTWLAHWGPM